MDVLIYKQDAIDALGEEPEVWSENDEYAQGLNNQWHYDVNAIKAVPSAQTDYTEMKQEFLRMASYIDVLLECSDVQKETLIGFISRLAEFMPWTEGD